MNLPTRRAVFLGLAMAALSSSGFANDVDHVANPSTVKINFGKLRADPQNSGASFVETTIVSSVAVAILLRGVKSPLGKFKLQKRSKVFGAVVWNDAKFVQINSNKTLKLDGENYKLIVPKGYTTGTPVKLEFDFGPKGEVFADLN